MPTSGRHGRYDLSGLEFSRHATERFAERVVPVVPATDDAATWLAALKNCRKLGTNAAGDAAYLAIREQMPFVLLVKGRKIVTVMTLDQFETIMADFGRNRWPRRFGRWLRKLEGTSDSQAPDDSP